MREHWRWRVRSRASAALLLIGGSLAASTGSPAQPLPAGTYALSVCRGPCQSAHPDSVVTGQLVIEPAPFALSELSSKVRDYLESGYLLIRNDSTVDPNACFVVSRRGSGTGSLAGITTAGFIRLETHRGDSTTVMLYQSPDAAYAAIVIPHGDGLRGRGQSYVGFDSHRIPDDSVIARRIGPPRRELCIRGVLAADSISQARIRRLRP
jgi:hypothetical protein